MRLRRLIAASCLAAVAGCSSAAESERKPTAATGDYAVPAGPLFAAPADEPIQNRTARRLITAISHTPQEETIRIVGFSFTIYEVADALVAADERGVDVQVILDGHSRQYGATEQLLEALGTDRKQGSWLKLTRGSARGPDDRGGTHQKSWSFTRTGDSRWVVMVGSMNLTQESTRQYTDMMSYVDRRDVWRAFNDLFNIQKHDRPRQDPAVIKRFGKDVAYFHPGFDEADDPALRLLVGLPDEGTVIRVAMYAWHGARGRGFAEMLADKSRAGAEVHVIPGPHVGEGVRNTLRAAGVDIRHTAPALHTKLTIAEYDDPATPSRRRHLVITGSDNWGVLSLHNDDVDLVINADRGRIYERYVRFFNRVAHENS